MTGLSALTDVVLATTEVKDKGWWGVLVVACAVGLFCGSIYLLLHTNVGNNLALMLTVAAFSGFLMLLSFQWMVQRFPNGPLGRASGWEVDLLAAQPDGIDPSVAPGGRARGLTPADANEEIGGQIGPNLEEALIAEDSPYSFTRDPRPYDDALSVLTGEDLRALDAAIADLVTTLGDLEAPATAPLLAAAEGVDVGTLLAAADALDELREVARGIGEQDVAAAEAAELAGEVPVPPESPVNQRSVESPYRIGHLTDGQRARFPAGALDSIPALDVEGLRELAVAASVAGELAPDALPDAQRERYDDAVAAVADLLPVPEVGEQVVDVSAANHFIIRETWETGGDRKFPVWFSKDLHVAAVHFCLADQRALALTPFGSPPVPECDPLADEQTAFVHLDLGARRIKAVFTFLGATVLFVVSILSLSLYESGGGRRRRRGGGRGPAPTPTPPAGGRAEPAPERTEELVG